MKKDILLGKDILKGTKPKKNKYRAKKITIDGFKFDSQKEAQRYGVLKIMRLAGEIKDFKMQVPYSIEVNGVHVCKYIADFVVTNNDGSVRVEDVKSVITANLSTYRLKKKLMEAVHGVEICEII